MTVILLRHGRSSANTAATLAGRTPGVALDAAGREQAARAAERLGGLPIARIVSSPLDRCVQTVAPLAARLGMRSYVDGAFEEVDYGEWTGRPLAELVEDPLWRVVQQQPSAVTFPGGESLAGVQSRSVGAVRATDRSLHEQHGRDRLWVACTHGDVIKSILADALGMHLDGFQRIATVPASVSVVHYASERPVVLYMNDTGSELDRLADPARRRPGDGPAPGAGAGAAVPGGEL